MLCGEAYEMLWARLSNQRMLTTFLCPLLPEE
jgi:hypothetical protein